MLPCNETRFAINNQRMNEEISLWSMIDEENSSLGSGLEFRWYLFNFDLKEFTCPQCPVSNAPSRRSYLKVWFKKTHCAEPIEHFDYLEDGYDLFDDKPHYRLFYSWKIIYNCVISKILIFE